MLAMDPAFADRLLDDRLRQRLDETATLIGPAAVNDFTHPDVVTALAGTEVLLTFWGCPPIDADVLANAPLLRAVVHAGGSVKPIMTDACRGRSITFSSAAHANSQPVAEYTVAMILLANKRVLQMQREYRALRISPSAFHHRYRHAGNYRRVVGIVGASRTGRRVIELLRPYDLRVIVYDPYLDNTTASALDVRRVELDELCATADVVSVHAPELPETRHLIDRRRLGLMRDDSTLINTARGTLVDQDGLTEELLEGRLNAVVDVTDPEHLPDSSPLYELPNVLLTPHIAGSVGNELHRMAESALDELVRYSAGAPFLHAVPLDQLGRTA